MAHARRDVIPNAAPPLEQVENRAEIPCGRFSLAAVFARDLRFGLPFISPFVSQDAKEIANHYLIEYGRASFARSWLLLTGYPGEVASPPFDAEGGKMGRKLYVGNLPFRITEEDLADKLSTFGTVESVKIITDRDTGRSKGFAFAEMGSDSEAQAAINGLNGKDMDGRPLVVNEARPQERNSRAGGRR